MVGGRLCLKIDRTQSPKAIRLILGTRRDQRNVSSYVEFEIEGEVELLAVRLADMKHGDVSRTVRYLAERALACLLVDFSLGL